MNTFHLALAVGGVTLLALGLASGFVKDRLWVSEPLIAVLVGVLAGPAVLDAVVVSIPEEQQNTILLEVARLTLGVSIMGAALRLPSRWEIDNWRELAVVLTAGMALMWMASGLLALAILGLPVLLAFLVGAVVTPTDPVLADSIVTGRLAEQTVPGRMRHSVTAESGANDGLALMFVMLPVFLLEHPTGDALSGWSQEVLLRKVLGAIAVGFAIGWAAARVFLWVLKKHETARHSVLTLSVSLALAVLGIGLALKMDSLLAVFVAGLAFNRVTHAHEAGLEEKLQTAILRFFDVPVFILIGILLPWQGWMDLGSPGVAFAFAVLLLRRPPVWMLLRPLLSSALTWRDAAFNGWFGPIGVSAVFYAMHLHHERVAHAELIWHVASLVVFCSVVAHGITATPFARAFGRAGGAAEVQEEHEATPGGPDAP